jgi:hypothetical protein
MLWREKMAKFLVRIVRWPMETAEIEVEGANRRAAAEEAMRMVQEGGLPKLELSYEIEVLGVRKASPSTPSTPTAPPPASSPLPGE